MCDEAVHDCLVALEFIPDCFVISKMINLYTLIRISSFIIKILIKSYLSLIKNIFVLQILKKLVLIILMKIIIRFELALKILKTQNT